MKQEKELTKEEYYAKREREEKVGKIFVLIVGIMVIVFSAINVFTADTTIKLFFSLLYIVAGITLLCGFSWARIFLGILSAWNAVWGLFTLLVTFPYGILVGETITSVDAILLVYNIISFAIYLFCTLVLFLHKGVKEYMYGVRNG